MASTLARPHKTWPVCTWKSLLGKNHSSCTSGEDKWVLPTTPIWSLFCNHFRLHRPYTASLPDLLMPHVLALKFCNFALVIVCTYGCILCTCLLPIEIRKGCWVLELELRIVVSYHVGTQVLCRNSKCSSLLSHLPSHLNINFCSSKEAQCTKETHKKQLLIWTNTKMISMGYFLWAVPTF